MNKDIDKGIKKMKRSWNKIPSETKSGLGKSLVSAVIIVLIIISACALIYFKLSNTLTPEELSEMQDAIAGLKGWGLWALIGAIFFYGFGFAATIILKDKYKKKEIEKDYGKYLLKLLIGSLCSFFVTYSFIESEGIKAFLWYFLLAFCICFSFFEIFSRIKTKTLVKLTNFPWTFTKWFLIPSMPFLIIILGSVNGLYHYQSTFLSDAASSLGYTGLHDTTGSAVAYSAYSIVEKLYTLGQSKPHFMLGLSICSFFILFFVAVLKNFGDKEGEEEEEEEKEKEKEFKEPKKESDSKDKSKDEVSEHGI